MVDPSSDFSIATINVHGITYDKIISLIQYLQNYPLHVLVITETHQSTIPAWISFTAFPKAIHRLGTSHSGGVSIYSATPITEQSHLIPHQKNTIACEVNTPAGPRIIVGIYHFGDEENIDDPQFSSLLDNITEAVARSPHPLIILGDFNMKHPAWSSHDAFPDRSKPNQQATIFRETLSMNDLIVLNTLFPASSRIATHDRGNTLDLILTNTPRSFSSCTVIENEAIGIYTDHHMVRATIPAAQQRATTASNHRTTSLPPKWITKKAAWKLFETICNSKSTDPDTINLFQSITDGMQHDNDTLDQLWSRFSSILMSAAESAVPTCPRGKHYRTHWWNTH